MGRAAAACLALLLLGAFSLSNEQIVRNFDLIVFHNEYRPGPELHVRKWVAPIRIYLDTRAGNPNLHRRIAEKHVRHLAEITGHDIRLTTQRDIANIITVFERGSKLDGLMLELFPAEPDATAILSKAICLGRYYTNEGFEIFRAVIVIPPDRAGSRGKLYACIVEEITQVLGLPNDSADVFPSIFNDKSINDELTDQDILLIRLLYDPRMRPGLHREKALELARELLPGLRR